MRYLLCLIFSAGIVFAQCQNNGPTLYKVGYKTIYSMDSSRVYKPGSLPGDRLHYRPLEIDVWYPAAGSDSGSVIEYGEFLQLLEQRSNRFQNDTIYGDMTRELVQYLSTGLNITDPSRLTHLKTVSYRNALAVHQPFPLIVYLCSFNGMSYENLSLLENLAGHGYIVASVTSVGRYPGNMSTDPADILEQVRDGLLTIEQLSNGNNVDPGKIGLIGYSWGGLAALLLSMNIHDTCAILSLDGSEMHYYGESAAEDKDFDRLRNADFFNIKRIHASYTYLESGDKQGNRQVDSVFNILPFLSVKTQYIHFAGSEHEDFSCFPTVAARLAASKRDSHEWLSQFDTLSLYYFDWHLKGRTGELSGWLSKAWTQKRADSVYPTVKLLNRKQFVISGRVVDHKDKTPLAYVNIGIPGKNTGTVTQHDGSFTLAIDQGLHEDSIRLSMAGYRGRTINIGRLLKEQLPVTISLDEKIDELKEVVVASKAPATRRLGNTTTSRSVSIGFPMRFLGAELGIRIKLGKRAVRLKSFNFNISDSRTDSAVFRLNIYRFDKGIPSENILQQNILVPIGKSVGRYTQDLSGYNLVMKEDILISLELIEGFPSGPAAGALFFSAGFLNAATWRRSISQAKWKRTAGIGVGFNIVVQE